MLLSWDLEFYSCWDKCYLRESTLGSVWGDLGAAGVIPTAQNHVLTQMRQQQPYLPRVIPLHVLPAHHLREAGNITRTHMTRPDHAPARTLPCGSRSLFIGFGDTSTPQGCLMRPEAADTSLLC